MQNCRLSHGDVWFWILRWVRKSLWGGIGSRELTGVVFLPFSRQETRGDKKDFFLSSSPFSNHEFASSVPTRKPIHDVQVSVAEQRSRVESPQQRYQPLRLRAGLFCTDSKFLALVGVYKLATDLQKLFQSLARLLGWNWMNSLFQKMQYFIISRCNKASLFSRKLSWKRVFSN